MGFREALEENYNEAVEAIEDAPQAAESAPIVETETDPKQETEAAVETQETAPEPLEPPSVWDAGQQDRFRKADRETQQWLLERHKSTEADYTRKTTELAEERKRIEPVFEALKPYEDMLFNYRLSPDQAISKIFKMQSRLDNENTRIEALHDLASSYGLTFGQLAQLEQSRTTQIDPQLQPLYQKIQELEEFKQQHSQKAVEQNEQELVSQITSWANEKGPDGKALRPHFNEVSRAMMGLIPILQGDPANQSKSDTELLQLAYEESVKPVLALLEKERKERVEKAKATKNANSSINGSGIGSASAKAASFREALERNYESMN